jgi:hypothetical protein
LLHMFLLATLGHTVLTDLSYVTCHLLEYHILGIF